MPESLIDHIRRHTTLGRNDAADAAQAVAEWLDRTGRRPRMGLVGGIVLRSAAKIIQGQVEREERR